MNKLPDISEKFSVDDIRRIREYNSLRHIQMSTAEIIEDTKIGAGKIIERLNKRKIIKIK